MKKAGIIILLIATSQLFSQNYKIDKTNEKVDSLNSVIEKNSSYFQNRIYGLTDSILMLLDSNIQVDNKIESLNYEIAKQISAIDSLNKIEVGNTKSIARIREYLEHQKNMILSNTSKFDRLVNDLYISNKEIIDSIESIRVTMINNERSVLDINKRLDTKIQENKKISEEKITAVDQSLSTTILLGIIAVLITILLIVVSYLLLNKRQKTSSVDLLEQLNMTKTSIEEKVVVEYGKQTELIANQLLIIEESKPIVQDEVNAEIDHSLALKLANEINLIQRNLSLMDTKVKGLKHLKASILKLKDNLQANGYEMPELLGKKFNQGMKVIVLSSIPDEGLDKSEELITKIIIPQVNYSDKMIQTAQIEVSVGY